MFKLGDLSAIYMTLYSESIADQADHFANAFVPKNIVYIYDCATM